MPLARSLEERAVETPTPRSHDAPGLVAAQQQKRRGWSVRRLEDATYQFEIFGFTSDRWLLALCDRLFAERINIISGRSSHRTDGSVSGKFILEATRMATRIFEIEISDTVKPSECEPSPYSISISDYALSWASRSKRFGPSIRLEITGLDRPGFLRTFFQGLEALDLDIAATQISTVKLRVHDTFWFRFEDESQIPAKLAELEDLLESLMDTYWAV